VFVDERLQMPRRGVIAAFLAALSRPLSTAAAPLSVSPNAIETHARPTSRRLRDAKPAFGSCQQEHRAVVNHAGTSPWDASAGVRVGADPLVADVADVDPAGRLICSHTCLNSGALMRLQLWSAPPCCGRSATGPSVSRLQ